MANSDSKAIEGYHHGNLKGALIKQAILLIQKTSIEKISLRALAAELGVSHNAPYMHFKSREALLAAIAEEGFTRLAKEFDKLGDVGRTSANWEQDFTTGCKVYISFGDKNPELFRVMFMEHDISRFPSYLDTSLSTLTFLSDYIQRGQDFGLIKKEPVETQVNFILAGLHGLALLHGGRTRDRTTYTKKTREQLIDACIAYSLAGIRS